jgi:hypothetical protein
MHATPAEISITHQHAFPNGGVGSHSALARPHIGTQLIAIAAQAIVDELNDLTDANTNPIHTEAEAEALKKPQ